MAIYTEDSHIKYDLNIKYYVRDYEKALLTL